MKSAAAFSLAIVCEGPDDSWTSPAIADRVLVAETDWLEAESLHHFRTWRGFTTREPRLEWRHCRKLADQLSVKVHRFGMGLEARQCLRALFILKKAPEPPDAVIVIRDTDGDQGRRLELERARSEAAGSEELSAKPRPPVILGVAHTKRECWVLAGFDPQSQVEERALAGLRKELGFDPRIRAEELIAREAGALRDAKRVAGLLLRDREREEACWMATDLSVLAKRGKNTGLADYLQEVRERLVPLFTSGKRR